MENHCQYHKDNTGLDQHMPPEVSQDSLARQDLKQRIMEKNKSKSKSILLIHWPHPSQACIQ
ncbi:hypothetical protein DPMN_145791 [Dreissena polymorpha]|uniref:Uncharacterized protein n=1 Tax=Dreissena polymorpha TaxID=45954 RepID=A0A9D4F5V1_DREPO|nr:hypothetical protein DPMN_145791 [Dreissena polymorpha]